MAAAEQCELCMSNTVILSQLGSQLPIHTKCSTNAASTIESEGGKASVVYSCRDFNSYNG